MVSMNLHPIFPPSNSVTVFFLRITMVYSIMHLNLVHGCTMYYLATVANQVEVVYNHLLIKTHLSYVE